MKQVLAGVASTTVGGSGATFDVEEAAVFNYGPNAVLYHDDTLVAVL